MRVAIYLDKTMIHTKTFQMLFIKLTRKQTPIICGALTTFATTILLIVAAVCQFTIPTLGEGIPPTSVTLLDEVGHLAYPVAASQAGGWKAEIKKPSLAADRVALLHVRLGEWELAQNQHPRAALYHFQAAQKLVSVTNPLYGQAAYDSAIATYYEGAYQEASDAFKELLKPRTPFVGYDRRRCALWLRHATAGAGYHQDRANHGIPEPPRLDPFCGAAALAACLRSLALPSSRNRVIHACRVTGEGSTMADILASGKNLDVSIHTLSLDDRGLLAVPKPLVAYIEHDHFVALIRADKKGVSYLCSDCGCWPGGKVNLTWKQWHMLDPGLYALVCRKESAWDKTFVAAEYTAHSRPSVQVATVGNLSNLLASHVRSLSAGNSLINKHIILINQPSYVVNSFGCTYRPTSLHFSPFFDSPTDGGTTPHSGPVGEDPVCLATGEEEFHSQPDLVVFNPHGPSIIWSRIYSSLRSPGAGHDPGDLTYECNDFGIGWSQPYNVGVYDPTYGSTGTKYVLCANGSRIAFDAPSIPSASQPRIACTVEPGAPLLVDWDYDSTSTSGHYTIMHADRTKWVTTTRNAASCCALAQIIDRNGNALSFNYTAPSTPNEWPLLSNITDASTGNVLLAIQRDNNSGLDGQLITAVSDCYGRSVYYHVGPHPDSSSDTELDHVSQIVPTGTANPPDRSVYGYQQVFVSYYHDSIFSLLHTITVPSPTGTGTSTATINYSPDTCFVAGVQDANGNLRQYDSVDANGNAAYFSNYTKVSVFNPFHRFIYSHIVGYDNRGSLSSDTNGEGVVVSTSTYSDPNDPNKPSCVTDGNSHSSYFTWDQFGNPTSQTSPRGTKTTYSYDYTGFALGELQQIQMGSKRPTSFYYNEPSGLVQSISSPSPSGAGDVTSSFTYTSLGNLLTLQEPGNNVSSSISTTFGYTQDGDYSQPEVLGEPITVTNSLGKVTHCRYDIAGHLKSIVDGLGHEMDFGDATSSHSNGYNLADQLVLMTKPATGQTGSGQAYTVNSYLYAGGPLTSAASFDESGSATPFRQASYTYGLEGETLSVTATDASHPITYTFDGLYRIKTFADGNGNGTRYFYNSDGELASVLYPKDAQHPNGDTVQFPSYDLNGNLLQQVDGRGVVTNYIYNDQESLLTDVQYPGTPSLNVHYSYDTYGRLIYLTDNAFGLFNADGTVNTQGKIFSYNDADFITSIQNRFRTPTGALLPVQTQRYVYWPSGSRQSMTTPAGSFLYNYDGVGRLKTLANPFSETTSWLYQDNGWLQSLTLNNGVSSAYDFDAVGEILDLAHQKNGTTIADFRIPTTGGYDAAGNRLSVSVDIPLAGLPSGYSGPASYYSGTTSYQYDQRNQLMHEQSTRLGSDPGTTNYSYTYGYDLTGNPTTFRGMTVGTGSFNANNQSTASGFTFDASGNPISYKGIPLTFDAEDRLLTSGH